jgi:cell division protein ZapA (FtsZ GTPase activity inhibitor)
MSKKKVQVTINNVSYSLVTDQSEEHLKSAAEMVDELVKSILSSGVSEISDAAVLSALQLASKFSKLEVKYREQEEQQQRLVERIEREAQIFASLS